MAKTEKYLLPNGEEYIPRTMGGFDNDVEGLRWLLGNGHHVCLLGDPGSGKTALMQAAFPDSENDMGHSKLTAYDMLWRPRIDPTSEHGVTYDPAPLTRAAQKGRKFYFDEIMRSSEDGVTPLFSAMDGRGFIVGGNLDATDLPVQPGFGVVAASNPLVRGAFMPDAIASRFHIMTVETSEDLLEKLHLDDRIMTVWRNLSQLNDGEMWKPSIREMKAAQKFVDADNWHQAAYALTGFRVPAGDRKDVAGVIANLFGVRVGEAGGIIK